MCRAAEYLVSTDNGTMRYLTRCSSITSFPPDTRIILTFLFLYYVVHWSKDSIAASRALFSFAARLFLYDVASLIVHSTTQCSISVRTLNTCFSFPNCFILLMSSRRDISFHPRVEISMLPSALVTAFVTGHGISRVRSHLAQLLPSTCGLYICGAHVF